MAFDTLFRCCDECESLGICAGHFEDAAKEFDLTAEAFSAKRIWATLKFALAAPAAIASSIVQWLDNLKDRTELADA